MPEVIRSGVFRCRKFSFNRLCQLLKIGFERQSSTLQALEGSLSLTTTVSGTTPSITYAIYVVIKPRAAGDDFPLGDIGVIDPLWINR